MLSRTSANWVAGAFRGLVRLTESVVSSPTTAPPRNLRTGFAIGALRSLRFSLGRCSRESQAAEVIRHSGLWCKQCFLEQNLALLGVPECHLQNSRGIKPPTR